jgi:hypothetical protein
MFNANKFWNSSPYARIETETVDHKNKTLSRSGSGPKTKTSPGTAPKNKTSPGPGRDQMKLYRTGTGPGPINKTLSGPEPEPELKQLVPAHLSYGIILFQNSKPSNKFRNDLGHLQNDFSIDNETAFKISKIYYEICKGFRNSFQIPKLIEGSILCMSLFFDSKNPLWFQNHTICFQSRKYRSYIYIWTAIKKRRGPKSKLKFLRLNSPSPLKQFRFCTCLVQ